MKRASRPAPVVDRWHQEDRADSDHQFVEDPAMHVKALLHEREGYVAKGRDDRVAQVDDQLAWWRSQ